MFELFTERARQVVVLAQDEERELRHNYIGTEHLLLGLLREEEGVAARALESLGVTFEEVRAQVARIVGQGDEIATGQIPFTPRAKKALELAQPEAKALGHNHIGTGHILLGLVRENEGVAARILLDLDADPERIRHEVVRTLSGSGGEHGGAAGPAPDLTLRRVVPIAHRCSGGTWIASVEIWGHGVVIRWAGSGAPGSLAPAVGLVVSDDVGTSYARRGGGAARSGRGWYGHIQFQPAPPPAAAALHIQAAADDLVSVSLKDRGARPYAAREAAARPAPACAGRYRRSTYSATIRAVPKHGPSSAIDSRISSTHRCGSPAESRS